MSVLSLHVVDETDYYACKNVGLRESADVKKIKEDIILFGDFLASAEGHPEHPDFNMVGEAKRRLQVLFEAKEIVQRTDKLIAGLLL